MKLESATVETFAPAVGETFALDAGDAGRLELELVEAQATGPGPSGGGRAPFSLLFRGPPEPVLPQRIYGLEHASLGRLDLFLVPVGRDAAGTRYEAVFA